jgi:RNA polymerase sigma factor (sigma-70 family)
LDLAKLSHRALIARCVAAGSDDPAWPEFFSRFHHRLRLIVYRSLMTERSRRRHLAIGQPAEVVEDLVQDVYLKLLAGKRRALAQFEGKSEHSIYTYLATIAVNTVRDHVKKMGARKTPPAAVSLEEPLVAADGPGEGRNWRDRLESRDPTPEDEARLSELDERIDRVLERTARGSAGQRDRLVFRLYFVERLTVNEIAGRGVGLSASGVEKCIRRLREILQRVLGPDEAGGGRDLAQDIVSRRVGER